VAGIPGLLGYRAVNTVDAMIGHRSPRYLRFGWAAARLDDVVNWLPARLAAVVAAGAAPVVGGKTLETMRIIFRDSGRHPSPNAGVVEAAFAGALGVRLGGRNIYHGERRSAACSATDGRSGPPTSPGPPGWPPQSRAPRWFARSYCAAGGHDHPDPGRHERGP
jgi:adenosylcobinamide-phosphate synthase